MGGFDGKWVHCSTFLLFNIQSLLQYLTRELMPELLKTCFSNTHSARSCLYKTHPQDISHFCAQLSGIYSGKHLGHKMLLETLKQIII